MRVTVQNGAAPDGGDPIAETLNNLVTAGALAGAATIVWRDGAIARSVCVGWRDEERKLPIERDSLFRIASMTKPVTSTAALMLLEEGRFALTDPIARWAPEFTDMRVLRSPEGPLHDTDPADRPITFDDLLTHRAGLTYGAAHHGPIAKAYADALGGDIDSDVAPDDWIRGLAALPLIDQPGTTLHYGHSTDLLGFLIARIEESTLDEVLKRRIFDPLGMNDTGFIVPVEKRSRRVAPFGFDDAGRLAVRLTCPGSSLPERPEDMKFFSGGQGLWSTANDYLAFARLFVGGGAVDGVRLLKPETLALMTTNGLSEEQRMTAEVVGLPLFRGGHGFGRGVAVVLDQQRAESTICGGHEGSVGWPGGFGGWWRADVRDNSVMIFLTHNMVERDQFDQGIGFSVYSAITKFQALASANQRIGHGAAS
jgi:CubicO group peptidase (beta-lactamase class C family)